MAATKRTKIQQQGMEEIVYQLIMKGESYRNVMKILQDKHKYSFSAAEKLYLKVTKSWQIKNETTLEELRAEYLEMYKDLYKSALANREGVLAKTILDSIVKLQGLITQKLEAKIDSTYEVKF